MKEREAELEQCYLRMEKGEAPSQEIDVEWQRMVRDALRRIEDGENRRTVS